MTRLLDTVMGRPATVDRLLVRLHCACMVGLLSAMQDVPGPAWWTIAAGVPLGWIVSRNPAEPAGPAPKMPRKRKAPTPKQGSPA